MSDSTAIKEIWKLLKESREEIKESREEIKESREEIKESREKAREEMKEAREKMEKADEKARKEMEELRERIQETDHIVKENAIQMKETDRRLKKAEDLFTTQWGRLVESLVEGDLIRLLKAKGIQVERTSNNEIGKSSYIDEQGKKQHEYCEIDIIAKNGMEVVAVEVKTTLGTRGVKKFIEVLKRFHQLFPEYKEKKVYGAVAYLRDHSKASVFAEKQGLFVIRATGNSSSIINQKNFQPRVFM